MFYFAETNYIPSFYLLGDCCDPAISSNSPSGLKCWWPNNMRGDSSFKYIKLLAVAWLLFTHQGMAGLRVWYSEEIGFLQVTLTIHSHMSHTGTCRLFSSFIAQGKVWKSFINRQHVYKIANRFQEQLDPTTSPATICSRWWWSSLFLLPAMVKL